jgi:hypothetical protein
MSFSIFLALVCFFGPLWRQALPWRWDRSLSLLLPLPAL